MKESNLSKQFLPKWQAENGKDSHLFRNNTGSAYQGIIEKHGKNILIKEPRWITFGIGILKKIKNKFRPVGGGDYIGWTSSCIPGHQQVQPCISEENCKRYKEMRLICVCPFKFAVFTSIEFKTKNVSETQDQKDWKALVLKSGGIAEVVKEGE